MPLLESAQNGNIAEVNTLVSQSEKSVVQQTINSQRILHAVIYGTKNNKGSDNHLEILKLLLAQDPDIYLLNQFGDNLLRSAVEAAVQAITHDSPAKNNYIEMIKEIMAKEKAIVQDLKNKGFPNNQTKLFVTKGPDGLSPESYLKNMIIAGGLHQQELETLHGTITDIEISHVNIQIGYQPKTYQTSRWAWPSFSLSSLFSGLKNRLTPSFWSTPSSAPLSKKSEKKSSDEDHDDQDKHNDHFKVL